jgi:hypothetical protein
MNSGWMGRFQEIGELRDEQPVEDGRDENK